MTTSISGTSGITFPNGSNQDVGAVGVGQTWQNMTASRAKGTTYTNDTGKPIMVIVFTNSGTGDLRVIVGGLEMTVGFCINGQSDGAGTFIVPTNTTYVMNPAGPLSAVWELR